MFTSPHGNHSHDIPFPKMKKGFEVYYIGGDVEFEYYTYDEAQFEWFEHGIHIIHFDEYHNVVKRLTYPTHRIDSIIEDVVTSEQIDAFDEWYAKTHNGMTHAEEQSMHQASAKEVARHKLAEMMGVDPDDIHFPFLDDEG